VKIYLVRHAKAQRRLGWEHADGMRPLSPAGQDQAMGLVERFDGVTLAHVLSSPALRCRQTAEPIAARFGLTVEADARVRGRGRRHAFVGALAAGEPALLSCRRLIPALVKLARCTRLEAAPAVEPTWLLPDGVGVGATYLPPPRAGAASPDLDANRVSGSSISAARHSRCSWRT
jgi:hypothetical protein